MKNTGRLYGENSRYEIRFAGSGGQGIVLAGIILAEAAVIDGRHVAQSQSYGPEARGGNSLSDVILSDIEIDYPETLELDILVALTQQAYDQNLPDMKDGGLLIVNSDLVRRVIWSKAVKLPFLRIARTAGEPRAINMVALGAVAASCRLASRRSLTRIITKRLSSSKVEANLLAFKEAFRIVHELKGSLKSVETKDEFEF